MPTPSPLPRRLGAIAGNVYRQVMRDRLLYLVALFTVMLVAAGLLLPEVAAGAADKLLLDLGLATIHGFSALAAILVGANLINQEVDRRTILVLLAKPVSPAEFVVGKHLGLAAVLTVLVAALGLVFLALMALQGIPLPLASLLWALGFTAMEAVVLGAIALFFGSFASTLLATLLSLGTYLMGHLSANVVSLTSLGDNPGLTRVAHALYLVLPDLERFNLRNQAVYGTALLPDLPTLTGDLVYGVVYIALLLSLASLAFRRRPL